MTRQHRSTMLVVAAVVAALAIVPALGQAKDYRKIKFPELPAFDIPQPEVYELDNGMTVFLIEDHELPMIDVTAMIRTGSNYEPADKVGLASIFGQVLREGGTSKMTGDEIDDWLAARAANIETGIGSQSGSAGMDCLKDDFEDVVALFRDILQDPAFDEEKIKLARVQENAAVARRNDNVLGMTPREFRKLVYGADSPLARNTEYATIAAVTRDDLVAWHETYFHPNNILLGVVGDFDSESMKATLQATFGDWERGPDLALPDVPYRDEPNPGVFFVEKDDVTQANIRVGHLGIERGNPDYFATVIVNEVLSGGFTSRLFSQIRTRLGLAYSVSGSIGASFNHPGVFQAGMQTANDNMARAVDALKAELVRIVEEPPTDDEIKLAKESILNSFVFNYASRSQTLGQQMTYAFYGMPSDYLEQYRTNIEKVTSEQVAAAAKKYIHPDKLAILVIGNPAEFDEPIDTLGAVTVVDVSIPDPPDTSAELVRSEENLAAGKGVLAIAAAATLGDDPASLQAVKLDRDTTIAIQGQKMGVPNTTLVAYPDRVRVTMRLPMGEQTMVIAGDTAFALAGGQVQELPPAAAEEQRREMYRDVTFLLREIDSDRIEPVLLGADEVAGAPCQSVAVTYEEVRTDLCIDTDGHVVRSEYQGKHPFTGAPGRMTTVYADFRDAGGGMQFPYRETTTVDGEPLYETEVKSIEVNPAIDESLFEKPAG